MSPYNVFKTDWGWMGHIYGKKGVKNILLPTQEREDIIRQISFNGLEFPMERKPHKHLEGKIKTFISGLEVEFDDLQMDMSQGTKFQKKVWQTVKKIPFGQTRSYGWVAEKIDIPKAPRAVGNALNKNPLPLAIPCHRVIKSGGEVGGFAQGSSMKEKLLIHEKNG
ncbi:MAG: methylated-DNA--[protein]-cysteine S-methyltransferase [Candidatus Altiarchaeota archaeon]